MANVLKYISEPSKTFSRPCNGFTNGGDSDFKQNYANLPTNAPI